MIFHLFKKKRGTWKNDALAGLTTSFAMVPEVIAFAFVAGVPPLTGLYAAFFVGLITAAFGGRPGMVSGAAGSLAVVMVALVAEGTRRGGVTAGLDYLFLTVILTGLIQLAIGALKLGRLIRLVPHPVMMGFVNGLAIVIFLAQLDMFKQRHGSVTGGWLQGGPLAIMIGLVLLTMAIIHFAPKITKAIPATLIAILTVSGIAALGLHTRTVGDLSSVQGPFPLPHWPQVPLDWETLRFIGPYAVVLALVGLTESLMTLQLIDEITETRGKVNRECVAQGAANVVAGLFKGMGGCAMIGQSLINITSGGRGRMSGVFAALSLLVFILVGAPFIDRIPTAALTGVMFTVVLGTFEWSTFKTLGRVPLSDILVIVVVTAITVWKDLATGVIVGVIVSALVFAAKSAKHLLLTTENDSETDRVYRLEGLLYFGSVRDFAEKFDPRADPDNVVIDFRDARVCDLSGLEAINALAERYRKIGKELRLRHLSGDCRRMLERAGSFAKVEIADDDPAYQVANLAGSEALKT